MLGISNEYNISLQVQTRPNGIFMLLIVIPSCIFYVVLTCHLVMMDDFFFFLITRSSLIALGFFFFVIVCLFVFSPGWISFTSTSWMSLETKRTQLWYLTEFCPPRYCQLYLFLPKARLVFTACKIRSVCLLQSSSSRSRSNYTPNQERKCQNIFYQVWFLTVNVSWLIVNKILNECMQFF